MTSWRGIERRLIAALRCKGCKGTRVIDVGGEPTLVLEVFDEETGQLTSIRQILSVEALARALEHIA